MTEANQPLENTSSSASLRQPADPQTDASSRRRGLIRRLYDWVLHWAETPYGTPALFLIAFAESSFFPIPPDVLQIALSVSKPRRSFFYAAISTIASILGGICGWIIGYALWTAVGDFFYSHVPGINHENVAYVGGLYQEHAFESILAAAFTPIPYKVFTIAAGIFHDYVSLSTLIAASALGRGGRFMLVASCVFFFGPGIRKFLERWLEPVTIVLFILIVLGVLMIKLMAH